MYEYTIVLSNGATMKVIAEDIISALKENTLFAGDIVNVFRNGKVSEMPPRKDVTFCTAVHPDVAKQTGCIATPVGLHTLKEGDSVILSASASEGWVFDHWETNGTEISKDKNAVLELGDTDIVYTAVFKNSY